MEGATAIPLTAWQQGGMVVLFALVVFVLLRYFASQQKSWQDFICKRDDQWQSWLNNRDRDHNAQLSEVTTALKSIATMLEEHDDKSDRHIEAEARRAAADEPKTARRPKAQ